MEPDQKAKDLEAAGGVDREAAAAEAGLVPAPGGIVSAPNAVPKQSTGWEHRVMIKNVRNAVRP